MKGFKIKHLALSLALIPTLCLATQPKLIFAADLIRHGNRSPVHPLTGSGEMNWDTEPGHLLLSGKLQQLRLGKQQGAFYLEEGLLPPHCQECLWVRSSNFERTRMSAQAFLQGFFSVTSQYSPTIHTVSKAKDNLLLRTDQPAFKQQIAQHMGSELTDRWLIANKKHFSAIAGYPIQNRLDFIAFADAITVRQAAGKPMPSQLSPAEIKRIRSNFDRLYTKRLADKELAQQAAQAILTTIMNRFNDYQAGKTPVRYLLLSGHDDNLLAVLNSVADIQHKQPPLASVLSFQFYQVGNKIRLDIVYNHRLVRRQWLNNRLDSRQLITKGTNFYLIERRC